MLDIKSVLANNDKLINRFVDLLFCKDNIFDSRHEWFYSLIPIDTIKPILSYISESDIRQDIYLYIIEYALEYKRSEKEFSELLRMHIGWLLRNKVSKLANYHNFLLRYKSLRQDESYILDLQPSFNFLWVLQSTAVPLTDYEKYLLYLYTYKCYTLEQIARITYQDRKSIFTALGSIKTTLKEYLNEK